MKLHDSGESIPLKFQILFWCRLLLILEALFRGRHIQQKWQHFMGLQEALRMWDLHRPQVLMKPQALPGSLNRMETVILTHLAPWLCLRTPGCLHFLEGTQPDQHHCLQVALVQPREMMILQEASCALTHLVLGVLLSHRECQVS
jgi:hypothetical protein